MIDESTDETMTTSSDQIAGKVPRDAAAWQGPSNVALVLIVALLVVAGTFALLAVRHHDQQDGTSSIRPSGIPASVSTPVADLMALSPVPNRPAPAFTLTDQNSRRLSLSSFKGRAVVIEFMDPHCTDICPLVSKEFVDAYHDLGSAASRVVFLAVNVNQYYASTGDMAAYSREYQLNTIPSWHFFTGSVPSLKAAWRDYGIEVDAPNPKADIIHTSVVFFIDPGGKERYIATPMDDHTKAGTAYLPANQLASWGRGIALITKHLIQQ